MNRRTFIQPGTMAASGLLARSSMAEIFAAKTTVPPFGLQLYTSGNLMTTDTFSALACKGP